MVSLNINAIMVRKPWSFTGELEENPEDEKITVQFIPLGAMTFISHEMNVRSYH